MATVLEEYTTEEQRSVVLFFCGQKDSMQRKIIKKYFLFIVGCVCRLKRFTSGSRNMVNVSLMTKMLKRGAEVAEATVKKTCELRVRRAGKSMEQMYQCWWRICREINVFWGVSNIICFMFYIHL
jgi:hypothetical protein